MTANCPLCSQKLPEECPVSIDIDCCAVIGNGEVAILTRMEMEVFAILFENYPRVATRGFIIERLYLLDQDAAEEKIIDVFVCKLRPKLKGLGVGIRTHWGIGHSLYYDKGNLI